MKKMDKENRKEEPWGILASIDIYNCNPEFIRSREKIKEFVEELLCLIEMKAFGETVIVHFGEDEKVEGFSMTQLIETSLISGHFANLTNAVYLDVFSCKAFDPEVVKQFAESFFEGKKSSLNVNARW